ncbi:hypothetical protein DPMN_099410 [Dreissena polymorpha]|uniref:Uncharacterized protein n=1 Tax=Dreissena polymorpha TaxID=45954 RepID=A0A9D4R858_DREPO|nr:hypothetical protein DPMN_099410 [Dreissena polymorpha]
MRLGVTRLHGDSYETVLCPKCSVPDTFEHLFFICPQHAAQRLELSAGIKPDKCTTITYHTLYTTIHRSPPRNPEHTGVALSYAPPVMSGDVRAIRVSVPGLTYRVVLGCGSR